MFNSNIKAQECDARNDGRRFAAGLIKKLIKFFTLQ